MSLFASLRRGTKANAALPSTSGSASANLAAGSLSSASVGSRPTVAIPDPSTLHFSQAVKPDVFKLVQTAWDGFACPPHVVAFDPVQSLLAVGNAHGLVRVYGQTDLEVGVPSTGAVTKFDVERPLQLPGHFCVQQMVFDTNQGRLVCVDDRSKIIVFDLSTGRLHATASAADTLQDSKSAITSIQMVPGSSWLVFGATDGVVRLFNVARAALSPYTIPCPLPAESTPPKHCFVMSVLSNPDDPNSVLIGYRSGDIFLWDMKQRKHVRRFTAPASGSRSVNEHHPLLTAVTWNPTGSYFASAYQNGLIAFWEPSNAAPLAIRFVNTEDGSSNAEKHSPITKLRWATFTPVSTGNTSTPGDSTLYIAGGGVHGTAEGKMLIMTVGAAPFPIRSCVTLGVESIIADFEMISLQPWMNGCHDPIGLVVLPEDSHLLCYDLQQPSITAPLRVPFSLRLNASPTLCIKYFTLVDQQLVDKLGSWQSYVLFAAKSWPLRGGNGPILSDIDSNHIVVTAHEDGHVRFWDASRSLVRLLCDMDALKFTDPKLAQSAEAKSPMSTDSNLDEAAAILAITHLEFDPVAQVLVLGWSDGEVMMFPLVSKADRRHRKTDSIDIDDGALPAKNNNVQHEQKNESIKAYEPGPEANGLVLTLHSYSHKGKITATAFCHPWQLLACGDSKGLLTVVDIEDSDICFTKVFSSTGSSALSKAERQAITSLSFSHSYASDDDDQLYPMLVVGLQNAQVIFFKIVRTANLTYDFVRVSSIQPRETGLPLKISILTDLGDHVRPKAIHWPPPMDNPDAPDPSVASTSGSKKAAVVPTHAPHFIVMALESQIRVHTNVGSDSRFSKVSLDDSFFVNVFILDQLPEGGLCLVCITADARIIIYSLPELSFIKSLDLFSTGSDEDHLTISALKQICITPEGRMLLITEFARCAGLQRCLLVDRGTDDPALKYKDFGIVHVPDVPYPLKPTPTGLMKQFLGKLISSPDPTQTFALWEPQQPAVAAPSTASPPVQRKASSNAVATTSADRDELLAGGTAPKVPEKDDKIARKRTQDADSAASAANRAMQGLAERGEKLNKASERTADMANEAQQFYETARRLREKNEKASKSWFPF